MSVTLWVNSINNNLINNNPSSMMRQVCYVIHEWSPYGYEVTRWTKYWSWLWSPEWSLWYRGYRVVGYSWCCARIMGKDQAPCGHLMITTVLFIPSLIWSWDNRVMSKVGKWCMWWLRGNPSRINGACSVIMFICSCHAHIMLAVSCCSCHVVLIIHVNPC